MNSLLGLHTKLHTKDLYVDGHEHEEQKKHRSVFTTEHLSRLEPSSHRWIQIEKTRLEAIQESLKER